MRGSWAAVIVALSIVLLVPPSTHASITSHYASLGWHHVAPGVVRDWGTVSAEAKGKQTVNVVHVDPSTSGIGFRTSLAHERVTARQRTTAQAWAYSAEGRRVVTAINGATFGSWPMGHVAARGLNVRDREVLTVGTVQAGRGPIIGFAVDSHGRPRIGTPSFAIEVMQPDRSTGIVNRINQGRLVDEAVLFTPRFDNRTWTDDNGDEYVIGGVDLPLRPTGTYEGTVSQVRRGLGNTPIGAGQLVLSATGAAAAQFGALAVGDRVSIRLAIAAGWEDTVHAVGGRDILVRNGQIDLEPDRPNQLTATHPRSAIGITPAGHVLLVTVDGRSSDSGGLTTTELAELMIERGAVTAMNLDGGGSTTLAVRRPGDVEVSIVNTPSDGTERTVATTLQLISSIPTGSLSALIVAPQSASLAVGQTLQYSVKGHDAAYNGVVVDTSKLNWQVANDGATVDANALLTAVKAGEHSVTARRNSIEDTVSITVQADGTPPVVSAPLVALRGGVGIAKTSAKLVVSWTAVDDRSGISLVELQRRVDGGSWTSISLSSATATSATGKIAFGRTVQYRARATDGAGNRSAWSLGRTMRVVLHDERSSSMVRAGEWLQKAKTKAIAGQFARSRTVGASMTLSAQGVQLAWVGVRSPKGGSANVFLSNVNVGSVSTYSASALHRQVLYVSPLADVSAPMATLSLRVVNAGTATRPRADVDAYLVLVTAD
jgi:hypothetical protein